MVRDETIVDLVGPAEARVREHGPQTRAALAKVTPGLGKGKAGDERWKALLDGLRARGLEVVLKGKSEVVRVPPPPPLPPHEQLLAALAGGARLPLKRLKLHLPGRTKSEQDAAVATLTEGGKGHIVVRTKDEVLVGASEAVLSADDLTRLERAVNALAEALKRARKKPVKSTVAPRARRTLLHEDVRSALAPLADFTQKRPGDPWGLITAALHRLEEPPIGLVSIPRLVRALEGRLGLAEVHRALEDAADAQWLELRPETGIELLSKEDEALCPRGSRDTVFSHVRLVTPPP